MSDIAMKLLEKQPEDRYPSTEALLQALEEAAEKGSSSPAWKVPLFPAEDGLAWLCATAGLGCPAAQVKPPESADCPQEATEAMEASDGRIAVWEGSKPGAFLLGRNVPVSVVERWP